MADRSLEVGLTRLADALEAIGYIAERRNCAGCRYCSEDAEAAYIRVGTLDLSVGRYEWTLRGFCPDKAESEARRLAMWGW